MTTQRLSDDEFLEVVRNTPLVSMDLVVRDSQGRVLLGLRTNEPAKGFWFVPGGRIRKDERLAEAFARLTREELGCAKALADARLLGVYEHLYDTNALGAHGVTTHYVVLGYELCLEAAVASLPLAQHSGYRWVSVEQLLADAAVHPNTQAYFAAGSSAASKA